MMQIAKDSSDQPDTNHPKYQTPPWRALFRFTTPSHYVFLSLALVFAVLSGVIVPALAFFLGRIFDAFTVYGAGRSTEEAFKKNVVQYAVYIVILGALNLLLNACFLFFWLIFGELQAKSARSRLYSSMLDKEMEWFDMRRSGIGALMPRVQSLIRDLQLATSQPLGFLFQYTSTIIAALGLALYSAWDLTLVVIASAPLGAVVLVVLARRLQLHLEKQAEFLELSGKYTIAALKAIDTVKCANAQEFELGQYLESLKLAASEYFSQARFSAAQIGFVRFLTLAIFVQGFWYGSHLVRVGSKDSGQILTAFWACLIATQTVDGLLQHMLVLEKGRSAGETLYSILTNIDEADSMSQFEVIPGHCEGDVQLANVSFAYPSQPERLVLDNVTMFFPAGETTIVVGESGSGKSTLSSLLLGFYHAQGRLTIDGHNMDTLDRNWLRNNITVMQQQSVLFNESIFYNIALGLREFETVTLADVQECIRYAALEQMVSDLPEGVHTMVGTGGKLMSGGQRQRISFARAKLRNTPILVFDEATSALDKRSAETIMTSIRAWRQNKTTIIITHDLTQVMPSDYVYVMAHGKLIQEGYRANLEHSQGGGFQNLLGYGSKTSKPLPTIPASPISPTSPAEYDFYQRLPLDILTTDDKRSTTAVRAERQTMTSAWSSVERSNESSIQRRVSMRKEQNRKRISTPFSKRLSYQVLEGETTVAYQDLSASDMRADINGYKQVKNQDLTNDSDEEQSRGRDGTSLSLYQILSTIWSNLSRRHRLVLLMGLWAAVSHAVATPVFSWVFSKLLGTYLSNDPNQSQAAMQWSLVVLAIAISDGVFSYLMHYLLEALGQRWVDALREKAYRRVLDQPRAWFDEEPNSTSNIVNTLDRNAEEMRNLLGRFLGLLIVAVTMVTIAMVWSVILCWKLTLVGLACTPFIYALTSIFNTINAKWEKQCNEAVIPVSESFAETFGNIRTVRALTLEDHFHLKHVRATRNAMAVGIKRALYSGVFFGVSDAAILFVIALLFWYSSTLVVYHGVSVQTIMTVVSMLLFTLTSVASMITFIPQLNSSRDTATQLLKLQKLRYKSSHEYEGVKLPADMTGEIKVTNLNFTYPSRPQKPAIHNLSLRIQLNTSTAIIGTSGAGKSTLIALLLRLYALDSKDAIRIASCPISNIHVRRLRELMALSPQYPPIFPTSIRANIAYGLPANSELVTMECIVQAAEHAGIHTFIKSLPEAYDTAIGEGGSLLSGGQTARIGLARALCRQPKGLILDEPTAGLDGISKGELVRLVQRLTKHGITLIVVTHDEWLKNACEHVVELKP